LQASGLFASNSCLLALRPFATESPLANFGELWYFHLFDVSPLAYSPVFLVENEHFALSIYF